MVEGHDRVDAEREGGYRVLFEHEFGRYCPYGEFLCAYMQRIKRTLTCSGMQRGCESLSHEDGMVHGWGVDAEVDERVVERIFLRGFE